MSPVWSPEAIADLAALRAYIAQDDPAAAQRVALHIIHNVEMLLPNSPEMGRPGRVPGTRELVIPRANPAKVEDFGDEDLLQDIDLARILFGEVIPLRRDAR